MNIQILTKINNVFFKRRVVHKMFRDILRQMFMIRFCIGSVVSL